MSQYFDNDESIPSHPHIITYTFFDTTFRLKTDAGVFSKKQLDEGTSAFLKVLLPLHLGERILDLGCGYGALGLTLAYFAPDSVFVVADINLRALRLTRENVASLGLKNVTVVESDIYQNIQGAFDTIVINPPIRAGKKVIYAMFEGAYDHLCDNGSLYIVIRKDQGAPSAQKFLSGIFAQVELLKRDKGYYIYRATKK